MPSALITGITGQDGSYMAELLLSKGYEVFGLVRTSSTDNQSRISHLRGKITLLQGDLSDQTSLITALKDATPKEVYNFAAQSTVPGSWKQPLLTLDINGAGVLRLLEAIVEFDQSIRFYQASSAEIFGNPAFTPQNENTPFSPLSPYSSAKVYAQWITHNYRDNWNLHASCGIAFNHESERRGLEFVTRKITNTVAKIKLGKVSNLVLGDLSTKRDWGYAPDYVEAMWLMLQQDDPDDYVLSSGSLHSLENFVEAAFACVGLDWHDYVTTDQKLIRPQEISQRFGNSHKAYEQLGWSAKIRLPQIVQKMIEYDLELEKSRGD